MKSNKKPTPPPHREAVIEEPRSIEVLSPMGSVVSQMSRDRFVGLMNGTMEEVDFLDDVLNFMEMDLADKERFFSLPTNEKIAVFKALDQRQSNLRKDIIRVHEIGARDEFNRNFFGIQARIEVNNENETVEGHAESLTKPARAVLSEIAHFVALRAMGDPNG